MDLPAKEGDKHAIAIKAIAQLHQQKPSPLAAAQYAQLLTPANYEQHIDVLQSCDCAGASIGRNWRHPDGNIASWDASTRNAESIWYSYDVWGPGWEPQALFRYYNLF